MTTIRTLDDKIVILDNMEDFSELIRQYIGAEAEEWYRHQILSTEDMIQGQARELEFWISEYDAETSAEAMTALTNGVLFTLKNMDVRGE